MVCVYWLGGRRRALANGIHIAIPWSMGRGRWRVRASYLVAFWYLSMWIVRASYRRVHMYLNVYRNARNRYYIFIYGSVFTGYVCAFCAVHWFMAGCWLHGTAHGCTSTLSLICRGCCCCVCVFWFCCCFARIELLRHTHTHTQRAHRWHIYFYPLQIRVWAGDEVRFFFHTHFYLWAMKKTCQHIWWAWNGKLGHIILWVGVCVCDSYTVNQ